MGIFDKFLGIKNSKNNEESANIAKYNQKTDLIIEKAITEHNLSIDKNKCLKVSFSDVAALGTAFSQLIPSLNTITMDGIGYLPVNLETGAILKMAKDGTNWGAYISKSGGSKFVKWMKAGPTSLQIPVNPGMIMVAAMLSNIEKKLDTIQNTQLKILSFLDQDKQAEQQGNLNVLTDIIHAYKYNWDNSKYLQNHHMKVLDIKQASEKNIIFYQEQIASAIKKLPSIYMDQAVKNTILDLKKLFNNYQMALYLFSFSSFLETLLLGNFTHDYLDQVATKVHSYDEQYQKQLSSCIEMIKNFCSDSIEKKVFAGIGNTGKALGKIISSSPILSKGPVDEWLQNGSEKLLQNNEESKAKAIALFTDEEKTDNELFVDSIRNVAIISNQTTGILFDNDTIYLALQ